MVEETKEVEEIEENEEVKEDYSNDLTEEEKFEAMKERLRAYDVPEEVITAIPKWKKRHKIRVAFLGDGAYIYRKLSWGELKEITNTIGNLSRSDNMTEAGLSMADLEFQLEKAVLFPKLTIETVKLYPSGDMETLQALINDFSGYTRVQPVVEDL